MQQTDTTFIDPMCGSGTFLIEAAMMAADIAPGLLRTYFGFQAWRQHDKQRWQTLRAAAVQRKEVGLSRDLPDIRGYDADPRVIGHAKNNIARAGLDEMISVTVKELAKLTRPTHGNQSPGLIVTNPPYGERMSDPTTLIHLYQYLGQRLIDHFPGWQAAVFTGNPDLAKAMGVRAHKKYAFYNGTIPTELLLFHLTPEWCMRAKPQADIPDESRVIEPLSAHADMLLNRLQKNMKKIEKWLKKEGITCYRLYDADIPEYAVAIDRYNDYYHVQEYAPPKTIDPEKAQQRLHDVVHVLQTVFHVPESHIIVKQRTKQKGKNQYQKLNDMKTFFTIEENGAKLLVNLTDYLDTGVFLDHRPVRRMIQQMTNRKRFLNLFCYTATATVHAGIGDAFNTTSVDMSATYCDWARKNLALNGLSDSLHRVIQADCMQWLAEDTQQYDVILLDPPTFSNSKRMQDILDIQRDHVALIAQCMAKLTNDGVLIFSNNFRKFVLDPAIKTTYHVEEITHKTFDPDFQRDTKLHHVWLIRALA